MFSRSSRSVAIRRASSCVRSAADQHLGDDIERRHARHHAEELADIAEGLVADGEDGARIGGREIDHLAAMADQDVAALRAIVAVQAAHQRGLADAGRAGQHDAFARMQFEPDARQHRDAHAALQMQGEALRQCVGAQHDLYLMRTSATLRAVSDGHVLDARSSLTVVHACSTELTSNCV